MPLLRCPGIKVKELELLMERETIGLPPTEKSPVISTSSNPVSSKAISGFAVPGNKPVRKRGSPMNRIDLKITV